MGLSERNIKYALVTGATSGFGYEFCRLLAGDRYNLVMVARAEEQLHKVAAEIAGQFHVDVRVIAEDLFDPDAARRVYEQTTAWNIPVEVLVNNASQGEHGRFVDYDLQRDIDLIQLNVGSVVSLTKLYLKDMLARNQGRILQVSSILGKYPTPLMAVYAGTKAFILFFTEALINELNDTNVTVTALLPGASDTDFFHKAQGEDTVVYRETELSDPADVARDGYDALMKGERRVVSGAKNKMQAAMSNAMPDSTLASQMRKQMEPSEKAEGRDGITHPASQRERAHIAGQTGKPDGDLESDEKTRESRAADTGSPV